MQSKWLHRGKSSSLIIFCNGWGMDEHPFSFLSCDDHDLLMLYDYRDLTLNMDLAALLGAYETSILIGWSMGVWAGQQLFTPHRNLLNSALAVNGTLHPVDDRYGISEERVRATCELLDEKQRLKFYRRMCRDKDLLRRFMKDQPQRSVEEQKAELAAILRDAAGGVEELPVYGRALVAGADYIIPTASQLDFWPEKMVQRVDGYHFLFYSYQSWDEISAVATRP